MDDKPDLNTSALNTLVLNTFDLNTSIINTPDQVTTEIDTTDLGTMDSESDLDSIGLPNTKAALIYRLMDPILEILWEAPILSRRLDNLTTFARLQNELDTVKASLQREMLRVRTWCNALRALDSEAINGPGFWMTMGTVRACEPILTETYLSLNEAHLLRGLVIIQAKMTRDEDMTRLQFDIPERIITVGRLLSHLRETVKGLHIFNEQVMQGRSRRLSTRHVTYRLTDEPLGMMFGAALQGI